jgi:4'-phosphopantetheinyl transferase
VTSAPHRPLASDEVHVWYTFTDDAAVRARCEAYRALLCDVEEARRARFFFDKDRHAFLVAHALLRTTLSRYVPVLPADWRFRAEAHGRPEIAPPTAEALRFNLSHTTEIVACAVTLARDLGVDVERVDADVPIRSLATYCFSPTEVQAVAGAPPAEQAGLFFDYWTLKESYIKARGVGLGIPLDRFSFALSPGAAPRIAFDAAFDDHEPEAWQFALHHPAPGYRLAAAVHRAPGTAMRFKFAPIVPMADHTLARP